MGSKHATAVAGMRDVCLLIPVAWSHSFEFSLLLIRVITRVEHTRSWGLGPSILTSKAPALRSAPGTCSLAFAIALEAARVLAVAT
jgi:hypothetical protein